MGIYLAGVIWYYYDVPVPPPAEKEYGKIVVYFKPEVDLVSAIKIIKENNCTIELMHRGAYGKTINGTSVTVKQITSSLRVPEGRVEEYVAIFESYEEVEHAKRAVTIL